MKQEMRCKSSGRTKKKRIWKIEEAERERAFPSPKEKVEVMGKEKKGERQTKTAGPPTARGRKKV